MRRGRKKNIWKYILFCCLFRNSRYTLSEFERRKLRGGKVHPGSCQEEEYKEAGEIRAYAVGVRTQ